LQSLETNVAIQMLKRASGDSRLTRVHSETRGERRESSAAPFCTGGFHQHRCFLRRNRAYAATRTRMSRPLGQRHLGAFLISARRASE
jgi:hypothetical protein